MEENPYKAPSIPEPVVSDDAPSEEQLGSLAGYLLATVLFVFLTLQLSLLIADIVFPHFL